MESDASLHPLQVMEHIKCATLISVREWRQRLDDFVTDESQSWIKSARNYKEQNANNEVDQSTNSGASQNVHFERIQKIGVPQY